LNEKGQGMQRKRKKERSGNNSNFQTHTQKTAKPFLNKAFRV
jgi:hypothetical protein